MLDILKNIFQEKIRPERKLPFPDSELQWAVQANRASLDLVDNWIDDAAMASSFFQYGVPEFLKKDINKPVGDKLTYTDLLLYLGKKYFDRINYLEIGVSVGKNFFQLLNALDNARFTGFDIEEINPVIEKKLDLRNKSEWETMPGSIKKNASSFKEYKYGDKEVCYLSADVWDSNSWARLQGQRFNLVFSDALHSPEAILFEFEMLVKFRLLDEQFIILWDDLEGKMVNSFYKIIRKYNELYTIRDIYLLSINGWVGVNERPHSVGIISNFNF